MSPGGDPSRHDLHPEGRESPVRFGGKLGERPGLAGGGADGATFERPCDNPPTPRANESRRVCQDVTFFRPKSFSILEAFAGDAERKLLRRAFDDAIAEPDERDVESGMRTRVRIGSADHDRVTGNAFAVGFDHAAARPDKGGAVPDPKWAKHVLILNAARDPEEDRIKAGRLGDVVRDEVYCRAAFHARPAGKPEAPGDTESTVAAATNGRSPAPSGRRSTSSASGSSKSRRGGETRHLRHRPQGGIGGQCPLGEAEGPDDAGAAPGVGRPAFQRRTRSPGGGVSQGDRRRRR